MQNRGDVRTRQTWMDLIRGMAVILVVLLHAAPGAAADPGAQGGWVLNNLLRSFRMSALLVLSGLLLQYSLSKGENDNFVWPRCRRSRKTARRRPSDL